MHKYINPYLVGYLLLYVLNFIFITTIENYPSEDIIGIFVLVGIGFSLVAYALSRKAVSLIEERTAMQYEGFALTGIVIYITLMTIWGSRPLLHLLPSAWQSQAIVKNIVILAWKLGVFVFIPFIILRGIYQVSWIDFGITSTLKKIFTTKNVIIFIGMSILVLAFNYFLGNAARPLREGIFSMRQIIISAPLLFIWLLFEVGLVEEFFFRALLQSRITANLKSEWAGICISGLIFGLIHAPGMYLRGAGTIEGFDGAPSIIFCMSYCIAVQSTIGFSFGIIWSKTRNLWLIAAIHAMTDLLPGLADFIKDWGI